MNKVMLIGNVGKEPDVKYYDADQAVAQFPLATTERGYVLQNGTRVPDRTDWHNIVMWRELAKVAEKYVHKGDKLYIEGRIRYRYYDDKNGQQKSMPTTWKCLLASNNLPLQTLKIYNIGNIPIFYTRLFKRRSLCSTYHRSDSNHSAHHAAYGRIGICKWF